MSRWFLGAALVGAGLVTVTAGAADELTPAQRGEKALLGRAFTPPAWSLQAYRNAWKQWGGRTEAPAEYDAAFRDHYGLHAPPYENKGLPMGLREASGLLGKGISTDCLLCHGGSILGQSYVGLGNTSLDIQALFEDLSATDTNGRIRAMPFTFCNVRGTSEAGAMSVFLLSLREPDLKIRAQRLDLGLRDQMVEDVPAWWLLKKKKTMYYDGGSDARSVRAIMQFMMTPLNGPGSFDAAEPAFRDIQAYLLTLQPPPFPFRIDRDLAHKGETIFNETCARCHGTYGAKWTYPNKIVSLEEIGTDPNRYHGISDAFRRHYNQSWFAQEKRAQDPDKAPGHDARRTPGYQAPPLDGVWATAPYFHNGSAPTVYHVLNSRARPKYFTRSYRTGIEDYDVDRVGWKVQGLDRGSDPQAPVVERRKVYDTTQPGRSNAGHSFGDDLTEDERRAVIEYLKTL